MLLQLRSGHTIEISTEAYLDMSDEEIRDLECLSPGQLMEINNPFYKAFGSKTHRKSVTNDPYAVDNITSEEKRSEMDYDKEDM